MRDGDMVDKKFRKKRRDEESGGTANQDGKKRKRAEDAQGGVISKASKTSLERRLRLNSAGKSADGEIKKKRRKDQVPQDSLQSSKNAADGVGIDAGFTMFKPKKKSKEIEKPKLVPEVQHLSAPAAATKPTSFLDKMRVRLSGGRFRMLNETLYTCRGEDAYKLFNKDPSAFMLYHDGYQQQMGRWPVLPVDVVIRWLRSRSAKLVVADFGCGDARLAKSVKNKVFSLDLISSDPSVIACNMAKTPLDASSVDVAVFCLSLMGTDYPSFLQEANRVLRTGGSLLVAEVKSRFNIGNGGASPQKFVDALQSLGFSLISKDDSNKMFIMFYLQKQKGLKGLPQRSKQWPELKACIYKRR